MRNTLLLFVAITLLCSCNDRHPDHSKAFFSLLSSKIEKQPDSVLIQLDSITQNMQLNSKERIQWNLLFIRAYDEKYNQIPNDSIIEYTAKEITPAGNISDYAYCLFYVGRLQVKKLNYNQGMSNYLSALDYAKKAQNHRLTGLIYTYIAKIHKIEKRYEKGIDALKKAEYYYELSAASRSKIFALLDIGSLFSYIELADSAFFYYTKAEVVARQINDKDALASISFQISKTYWDLNDLESAEYYLNECSEQLQDSSLASKIKLLRIQIYIKQNKFNEAKTHIIHLLQSQKDLSQTMKAANYISLAEIERKLSNYPKALLWQDKYIEIYDSIISLRLTTNTPIVELTKKTTLLKADNDRIKRQNTIGIYVLSTFALICLVLLFLFYSKTSQIKLLKYQILLLKKENKGYESKLQQKSVLISKINLLSQTPSHKQNEVEKGLEELAVGKEISPEDWTELEEKVNQEHNHIIQTIKSTYPNLTNEDCQTIILILLGYRSGEISTLLNIEITSLKKRRQRLRQRLGLAEKDSLEEFIMNISDNQSHTLYTQ